MSAYAPYFIVMATAVVLSVVGGILASRAATIPACVRWCLALAGSLAGAVLLLSRIWPTDGFILLLVIATFMYSTMISFGVAMTFRRLRQRR